MTAMSRPMKGFFGELTGAGTAGLRRAALGLIVLAAATGAAYRIGQTTVSGQDGRVTAAALEESPGQARTLDDILAESGEEEADALDFSGETAIPPTADIGGLVARLDRQVHTLAMIDEAAARVGAPARLMRAMAGLESGLNATAKASTSSATGLYQFIEATWLSKVERDGHKYGLGRLAKQIRRGPSDEPIVDDLRVRDQILALRKNARLSAYLAAELTVDNTRRLEKLLGRPVTATEVYLGHVFGVTEAARFLKAADATPDLIGAGLFPKAAKANPGIFKIGGAPATLGEIRKRFTAKMAKSALAEPVQVADWQETQGEEQTAAIAMR